MRMFRVVAFPILLVVGDVTSWMQCPTLVNEMTPIMAVGANLLHLPFKLPLLGKFPEFGQYFTTS
jgi:hypothetical protein